MIAQPHMSKMRHRCRNPRCGDKLKESTDNPREAFCCEGCFKSYYRNRCIVDERPYRRVREDQHTCGRRKCKGELRRHPLRYFGRWLQVPGEALSAIRNPIKSALKTGITGWRWVLCHEYRRSKRRCVTVREMKVGPSRSAIRC